MESDRRRLNRRLNQFYDANVTMKRHDTTVAVQAIGKLVHNILSQVHSYDKRYMIEPIGTGSYYQGLKVNRPDEFDYSVKLDVAATWQQGSGSGEDSKRCYDFNKPGIPDPADTARDDVQIVHKHGIARPSGNINKGETYLKMRETGKGSLDEWRRRGINNDGEECLTFDGDLILFLVKRKLKKMVEKAVKDLNLTGVCVDKKIHGPATTLKVKLAQLDHVISVDLSPVIIAEEPFPTSFKWPRPDRSWPSREVVDRVKKKGINFVAKKNFVWSLDTVRCERELLLKIDGVYACRKKCQKIMKELKRLWSPVQIKPVLSSYCLKNVLYWECEKFPSDEKWSSDMIGERIISMTKRLIEWLKVKKVPWYFCPDIDILRLKTENERHLAELLQRLEIFQSDPIAFLDNPKFNPDMKRQC